MNYRPTYSLIGDRPMWQIARIILILVQWYCRKGNKTTNRPRKTNYFLIISQFILIILPAPTFSGSRFHDCIIIFSLVCVYSIYQKIGIALDPFFN